MRMSDSSSSKTTILYILLGILLAFSINQGMALALSTDMPVVAVESNSMCAENACTFSRGDLLILQGVSIDSLNIGDIIVFSAPGTSTPIVHRIIKINDDGTFQTKGDANNAQLPFEKQIEASQIHGKEIAIIPLLGWVKIGLTDIVMPNMIWIIVFVAGTFIIIRIKPDIRRIR